MNLAKIQELEKKWGITITFPSSEDASDNITIKGPEWQLPDAVNEFLVRHTSSPSYRPY